MGHWAVENSLHWVLDVGFREDESRVREGHGAENLSTLRRIALNLLKQDTTTKLGIKNKRLAAGWDEAYLLRLLGIHVRCDCPGAPEVPRALPGRQAAGGGHGRGAARDVLREFTARGAGLTRGGCAFRKRPYGDIRDAFGIASGIGIPGD